MAAYVRSIGFLEIRANPGSRSEAVLNTAADLFSDALGDIAGDRKVPMHLIWNRGEPFRIMATYPPGHSSEVISAFSGLCKLLLATAFDRVTSADEAA